jgi:hypothetical protein
MIEQSSTDELLRRRGELAYAAQMCALEQLPPAPDAAAECAAIDAELARRGVDLSAE